MANSKRCGTRTEYWYSESTSPAPGRAHRRSETNWENVVDPQGIQNQEDRSAGTQRHSVRSLKVLRVFARLVGAIAGWAYTCFVLGMYFSVAVICIPLAILIGVRSAWDEEQEQDMKRKFH